MKLAPFSLLILFLFVACQSDKEPAKESKVIAPKEASLRILRYAKTEYIPSASGVEFQAGAISIIGDDSPFIHSLSGRNWSINSKTRLFSADSMIGKRIFTKIKPDYEAMSYFPAAGANQILVVGSGSRVTKRDTCVLFDTKTQKIVLKRSLRSLYDIFRDSLGFKTKKEQINVEGLAINGQHVYIAHRGNVNPPNAIFRLDANLFFDYLMGKHNADLAFETFKIEMPNIDGEAAGISGLDIVTGSGLLMSASIEATKDPARDGDILGSYIAYLPFGKLGAESPKFLPLKKNEKMLITKLESVAVKSQTADMLRIVGVSDNDDGTSEFFEFELANFSK